VRDQTLKKDIKNREEYKEVKKIKDKAIKDMYCEFLIKIGQQDDIKG
jgi:hypothetical protein